MRTTSTGAIGRRAWLAGLGAAWLSASTRGDEPDPAVADADADADARAIRERGRKAGLGPFRSAESRHYRVIGDAPDAYLKLTLDDCEAVAADYLDFYRARGFAVARPPGRLTAVAFADVRSYAAFLGGRPDDSDGGRFDRASNRLYVHDYRPIGVNPGLRAGHVNLAFLAHEATHQLAFNTGLLDRAGDVPRAIGEGIALFGEVRKPAVPSPPGLVNDMRLTDLARKQRAGVPWITLPRLLVEDALFDAPAGFDALILAYAQAWLLAYHLLKDPALLPRSRDYLAAIRPRRDPRSRLDDARAHLGDLGRIDADLKRLSIRLLKAN